MSDDEIIHPLNGRVYAPAPTVWVPEVVAARLIEACIVIANTTALRRSPGNGWPAILREYSDFVGYADEARGQVLENWSRIRPTYDASTIHAAEQAARWPAEYLAEEEGARRVLLVWAAARAANKPVERVFKSRGWSTPTARRKRSLALDKIAQGLNKKGVRVIEARIALP